MGSLIKPLSAMTVATTQDRHAPNNTRPYTQVANGATMNLKDWWNNTGKNLYTELVNTGNITTAAPVKQEYTPGVTLSGVMDRASQIMDRHNIASPETQQAAVSAGNNSSFNFDAPEVYQVKTFDKDAKFREMYGTNASRRDRRRFEKYWDSDQRWADQDAFEKDEHEKQIQNWDARFNAIKQQNAVNHQAWLKEVNSKPLVQTPLKTEQPVVKQSIVKQPVIEEPVVKQSVVESNPVIKPNQPKIPTEWYTGIIQDNTIGALDNSEEAVKRRKNANEIRKQLFTSNSYLRAPYNYNYASHYINGKEYPIVVTKKLGVSNKHNDQSFYYDPETKMYAVAKENWSGQPQGFATYGDNKMTWYTWDDIVKGRVAKGSYNKQGGILIKKHQQGGNMEQDIQTQVKQLVQAVAAGDQQAAEQVKQIMQAAEQGDQQALQIAQMIQAEIESMKTSAKLGAKLNYIKQLKGDCLEGEELVYFKKGGMICNKCEKKHEQVVAAKGKKLNAVDEFKKTRKSCKK